MNGMNFIDLMKVSPIMPVILFCSIILVAYAIERFWYYAKAAQVKNKFLVELKYFVQKGKIQEA